MTVGVGPPDRGLRKVGRPPGVRGWRCSGSLCLSEYVREEARRADAAPLMRMPASAIALFVFVPTRPTPTVIDCRYSVTPAARPDSHRLPLQADPRPPFRVARSAFRVE